MSVIKAFTGDLLNRKTKGGVIKTIIINDYKY